MWAASKRVTETPGNSRSRRAAREFGKLVEDERCAGHLGEDGEQAGAGRRLQHEIARRERGREAGDKAERDRRRELLKGLALLGAAGVRGQQRRELAEHGELRGGRDGTRPDGRAEFAQEQHLRGLAGVIGQLPAPRAFGVAAAEGLLHGGAQRVRVDGAAAFEMGQQKAGGADQRRGRIGGEWLSDAKEKRPWRRPRLQRWESWEEVQESGNG